VLVRFSARLTRPRTTDGVIGINPFVERVTGAVRCPASNGEVPHSYLIISLSLSEVGLASDITIVYRGALAVCGVTRGGPGVHLRHHSAPASTASSIRSCASNALAEPIIRLPEGSF